MSQTPAPGTSREATLEQELASMKAGYRQLDRNWEVVHEAAMRPIREALGLPDGTVPELVQAIKTLQELKK